jgi:triacylglycerol esterase/lipase EstA (alpha/beta hydrolase family)
LYNSLDPDVTRHLAQVPLLTVTLLSARDDPIEPGVSDGHPPLVFVHGLGGSRGDFVPMSWYLWLAGRRRTYRIRFAADQSVDEMAKALARFVRKVRKVTGQSQVDIVAHSLGGVVARVAVTRNRLGTAVRTLVTLGSPHRGTWSARFASTTKTRDLRPDSPGVLAINARPWPRHIRVVNVWSRNDLVILPHESAWTDGAQVIDASPFTHYSYLLDPAGWELVKNALADS